MRAFTEEDLTRIVREAAGEEGGVLEGDVLDTTFADLGYDSLAMFEIINKISRDYGVPLGDGLADAGLTYRELLETVTGALATVAV
jgi:act minimal PKS acyl carrier protein